MFSQIIIFMSLHAFGKKQKERVFRLIDEYSLFYLTWVDEIKGSIFKNPDSEYWNKKYKTPAWYAWAGHAFENICFKHSGKIKQALGIRRCKTITFTVLEGKIDSSIDDFPLQR